MKDYIIITDIMADLTPKQIEKYELKVMPSKFASESKEYMHYPDFRELSQKDFYNLIRKGEKFTTSQVNIKDFEDGFEEAIKDDKDILCLIVSSVISGTYNAAQIAKESVEKKYPDAKIEIIDTLSASLGQGLLVYYAYMNKKAGKSLEENEEDITNKRLKVCHLFTVDDLNHLKRGGRISSASAILGTMMGIKPILHVNDEGKLTPTGKVRGREAAINNLFEKMEELGEDIPNQTIFISHGDCEEDANKLANMIKKKYNVKNIEIGCLSPIIASHAGPGTIALFFIGSHR